MTGRTYLILVVEDNPGDAYIIGEAFKDCGYPCDLTFAPSHEEGQRILPTQAFDLLLSDFGTNIEAATAFIQQVRAQAPRLPIVILSGSPNPNIAYEAGANAFIKKVAHLDTFYAKIKGLMDFGPRSQNCQAWRNETSRNILCRATSNCRRFYDE